MDDNKKQYETSDLFTVEEVRYEDGQTLYMLKGIKADGTTWSSGMHNSTDLIVHVLQAIGKIELSGTKTFYDKADKSW